ncbi:unnamed protein product [Paramecium octaurelia]|uniref:Cyclin-dependent kinase 2 homolog n=1 Tax=Paramecium octaurelia TaxID=43137 RepID=A0A8S1WXH1_PAROT|nr:unnamed protein product [Paramecium octaurelia]
MRKNEFMNDEIRKHWFANCRSISEFERLDKLGEGTYGTVYAAKDKKKNQVVAIKKVKIHDSNEGFPITCLREIKILQRLSAHPNVVNLLEVAVGPIKDSIHLVFEYCAIDLAILVDNMFIDNYSFRENEIKCIVLQLLNGLAYINSNFILHRDIKLSNLLLTNDGIVKIADFGLAREFEIPQKKYTNPVVTLWYRAPELLCQMNNYNTAIDIWSVGCVFAELINRGFPILQGKSEIHQLQLMCEMLGYPNASVWPDLHKNGNKQILKELEKFQHCRPNLQNVIKDASPQALELISRMLTWDPEKRIGVMESLLHEYFYTNPRPSMPEELSILRQLDQFKKKNADKAEKKIKIK